LGIAMALKVAIRIWQKWIHEKKRGKAAEDGTW